MRLAYALLLSTALVAPSVQAAEITHQGALDLERKYTSYLPADLANSGLIKVRPGTEDYEITFDPTVFLKNVDQSLFSISGLKPILSLVRPMNDGLWRFAQTADLDVKGHFTAGTEKTDFSYKIDAMRTKGIVDPDLLYFRSAEMTADGIFMTTKSPQQFLEARFGSIKTTIDANTSKPGLADINAYTAVNGFSEKIVDPAQNRVDISADSVNADVAFKGLAHRPLQDMIFFLLDRAKDKSLAVEDQARLKELISANIPMFETLQESIELANLGVDTPAGTFGAEKLRYSITSNGIRDDARFGLGLSIDKPSLPPGLVPQALMAALPETVSSRITVENINLASGIGYILDHADFNAEKPMTDEQSAKIGRVFLPGGRIQIKYEEISARSSVYDFSLSGRTTIYPAENGRQNTDITIYAKNFDETVAYLQKNATTVPQFGQAAFVLLMVKGFAKQAPDGRQMWNVILTDLGQVKINGQYLPL